MMKLGFRSILVKILFMITLACFMQGIVMINMSYAFTKKALYNQINDSGLKYAESSSQTIGGWIAGKINEITIYSNSPIVKTMDWGIIGPYLQNEISTKLDIYDHLFISDTTGNYSTTLKANAGNVSDRAYFKAVMQDQAVVSDPMISKSTGNQMAVIAVPVKNEKGEIIGLVGGSLNLVKLNNFIKNYAVNHNDSYSYIIDKNGTFITYPDAGYTMQENITIKSQLIGESLVNISHKILNNDIGYVEYTHNGVKGLHYYSIIPNTNGWKLVVKVPSEYLNQPLAKANIDLAMVFLVGIIISLTLAIFVSKSISHPIIQLSNVFNKASNGDLNVKALDNSKDEIGQAAHSFNKMMDTIRNLTFYDTLTRLPNKLQFMDRLSHEIGDCDRDNERLALMIFDVDKFENINNAFGHTTGDKLIQMLAANIKERLVDNELACRLGDDRFAILLPDNAQETYVVRKSKKLLEITAQPWNVDNHIFHITASLGIAFYPSDGDNAEDLLKNAMSAMMRSKKNGRGSYQLYDSESSNKLVDLIELDSLMHHAIDKNEFVLHYQPQVELSSGKIVGVEALIRWNNPKLGMISPARFIPLAEENGLIVPIGEWVLRTACMQTKKWLDEGYDPINISVNISEMQIRREDFIEKVSNILKETGMDPKQLELEITEGIAMEDTESRIKILEALKNMGIRIAIDDFGTGYSSLNYLRKFHVTTLKIDQSFIRELVSDSKDAAIVSTILAIGQNLNLTITAEGVETKEQLEILKEKKCDNIQGYLYSRPLPKDQFEELIKNPPKLI